MGKNMKGALVTLVVVAVVLVLYYIFIFLQKDTASSDQSRQNIAIGEGQLVGPGGCRGAEACKSYCEQDDHLNECLEFSLEAGFISQEEFEHIVGSSTDEFFNETGENNSFGTSTPTEAHEATTSLNGI
ncbi:MAG: hypothetical protein NUV49_00125 [Patescibacteria group bacterium]|nr:hypothetical protein [Patescibacteria group bacterium]